MRKSESPAKNTRFNFHATAMIGGVDRCLSSRTAHHDETYEHHRQTRFGEHGNPSNVLIQKL